MGIISCPRNLYGFQDFVGDCVSEIGKALIMNPCDLRDHQSKLSSGKDTHYPLVKEKYFVHFRTKYELENKS